MTVDKLTQNQNAESTGDPLEELLRQVQVREGSTRLHEDFARALHFKTPRPYLRSRPVEELATEVVDTLAFIDGRGRGEIRIRWYSSEEGSRSILQVNLEDQPFILSTVQQAIRSLNLGIQSYLHPIVQVDRDESRRVVSTRPLMSPGAHESLLHIIFDATPPETLEALEKEIRESLEDARAAVADYYPMKQRVEGIARELQIYPAADMEEKRAIEETVDLLHWLLADNFIFLGCRSYRFTQSEGETWIQVMPDSGLGVLREERGSAFARPVALSTITEPLRKRLELRQFPVFIKGNRKSKVHRRAPMDYVEIKQLDVEGKVVGEHRILGLLTADALHQSCAEIPVLREKLKSLLRRAQVLDGSHEHKEIVTIFNNFSRHELFATDLETLCQAVDQIREHKNSNRVSIFCRSDIVGQGLSIMVILPRDNFSSRVRRGFQDLLCQALGTTVADYHLALSEDSDARLHFYFQDATRSLGVEEIVELEAKFARLARTWEDTFAELIQRQHGEVAASRLLERYLGALPQSLRGALQPHEAVEHLDLLERHRNDGKIAVRFSLWGEADGAGSSVHILRSGQRYHLSELMPALTHFGLRVIDEAAFQIESPDYPRSQLHSFRVLSVDGQPVQETHFEKLEEAILAVLEDVCESDPLNLLVLAAGLRIREVELVRAYVRHYQQCGAPHSLSSITQALSLNPEITRNLVLEYFHTKFEPSADAAADSRPDPRELDAIAGRIHLQLEAVEDINQDRILRGLLQSMVATVRTSYFQEIEGPPRISLKFESRKLSRLQEPVPLYEIFVYSRDLEGIHLRSSRIARGGIRWSDRRDDFRAEVHGLMSTQITKNSIIVPGGSKGGFIIKRELDPEREVNPQVEPYYRLYIEGLLDLTDNRTDEGIVQPPRTVCHDEPDPYLVVAADKGTSTFSDAGNEVAERRGFWLGDAFASGGTNGYDHKRYGITARGAWECNRHHFLELGIDVDREPFTVAGIGDMSGDVFGNGMLCSRMIRLVAAFDHRHIFLDPDPDPETSFQERERLFRLPRSSWNDYDRSRLSPGGGVFPRSAKKITLSPELRKLLETEEAELSGEEVVSAILKLPVDLLYSGGIGTYVKASGETHADARDERNTPVRVNSNELRCRVVVEGGNLGLTPRARVEYARLGGKVNTDFIDNSGGVHLSDREVNIKVALGMATRAGTITREERNSLLQSEAVPLCEEVLSTNRDLSLTLSLEEHLPREDFMDHLDLIESLKLDSTGVALRDLASRRGGELGPVSEPPPGLSRPELARLLSHATIEFKQELARSEIQQEGEFDAYLTRYFPRQVQEICLELIRQHPLRKEITITGLVNEISLRLGVTQIHRLQKELGVALIEVVRAYRVLDPELGGASLFARVREELAAGRLPARRAYELLWSYRESLLQCMRSLLCEWPQTREARAWGSELRHRISHHVRRPLKWLEEVLPPEAQDRLAALREAHIAGGLPAPLASHSSDLVLLQEVPGILARAEETGQTPGEVARVYFTVLHALQIELAQEKLAELPCQTPTDLGAVRALRSDLQHRLGQVTAQVLRSRHENATLDQAVGRFFYHLWPAFESYLTVIEEASAQQSWTLSTFVILTERLRRLEKCRIDRPLDD